MTGATPGAQNPDRRTLIVGRSRERAKLHHILDEAVAGRGSLVLISGAPGIGKTTLVGELIRAARNREFQIMTGGCYDLVATPPYGPWAEAVNDAARCEGPPFSPAWLDAHGSTNKRGSQFELFEDARRFFARAAQDRPLLIVLEDLHWADEASLDFLRYFARSLAQSATLVIATYRDDEINREHYLYRLLPPLIRESNAERIPLASLDRDDIRVITAGRYPMNEPDSLRLVEHVWKRSQGNPFFANELLLGLEADLVLQPAGERWTVGDLEHAQLPMLLRLELDRRLARVSESTRAALPVAAVAGQIVPVGIWARAAGLKPDAFAAVTREAIEARILEAAPGTGELQFRHALLREAIYEAIPILEKRELHRRIGEALSETPEPAPNIVAHHFELAGDRRAGRWFIRAGMRAERSYARAMAANYYATAQRLFDPEAEDDVSRGWLLLHTGHLLRSSDAEGSTTCLRDAEAVARQENDPLLEAISRHLIGLIRCFQGDIGIGLQEMENAIAIYDGIAPPQHERSRDAVSALFAEDVAAHPMASPGGLLFQIGRLPHINILTQTYVLWLANAGRFAEAMRVGKAFVEHVSSACDDVLTTCDVCRDAYNGLAIASDWLGRPEDARRWRSLAFEAYRAIGHLNLVRILDFYELAHLLIYRPDRLAERRRAAARASAEIDGRGTASHAFLDLLEGRWDAAQKAVLATLSRRDFEAQQLRVEIASQLGREQEDDALLAAVRADIMEAMPDGPRTEPGKLNSFMYSLKVLQVAASLALDDGDLDGAREWITAIHRWLDWSGAALGRADVQMLEARRQLLADDLRRAREHAKRALEHARSLDQPLKQIAALRLLGRLDGRLGAFENANASLRASLELAQRCDVPFEEARTSLTLAEVALASGNGKQARTFALRAQSIGRTLGASRLLRKAGEIQTALSPASGADDQIPCGLTRRELEVLQLAAEGMTDAQIADCLYLSPRTIGVHLQSVYRKLGVHSRVQATRVALEQGLDGYAVD